jgi:hypothetical protein
VPASESIGSSRLRRLGAAGEGSRRPRRRVGVRPGLAVAVGLGCLAAAALSLLLPATPTYDPWAWIIWGREITELDLSTESGPSWKPLPIVFTTLFAPLGDAAPDLWLLVARTGALLALVLTFRLAYRLAGRGGLGLFSGAVALAGLVLSTRWVRVSAVGNTEGLLVAFVLLAVERHLEGARRQAFALGVGAALLRPEVWPFLALYALYLWRAEPRSHRLLVALLVLVPALWFGPELWGSGDPLRASTRARAPNPGSPAFADQPALEVLRLARDSVVAPIAIGFALGLAGALAGLARRRARLVLLALALAALAWVAIVAAMTEAGYAGNPRYLVLAAALACVVAGVAWGRLVELAARLAGRLDARLSTPLRALLPLVLVAGAIPLSLEPVRALPDQLGSLRNQADLYDDLGPTVERAGGREAVTACGHAYTGPYQVPALAWHLRLHLDEVGFQPRPPGVLFRRRGARGPEPEGGARFRPIVSTREWDVVAACRLGRDLGGG